MTRCAHTNKEIRCPDCNSIDIHIRYCETKTLFFCNNNSCKSMGHYRHIAPHYLNEHYPEVFGIENWEDNYTPGKVFSLLHLKD